MINIDSIAILIAIDVTVHVYAVYWMFKSYKKGIKDGVMTMIEGISEYNPNKKK